MTRWVEVDLDALAQNYREIRQKIGTGVKLLGVVKADAYGHGALEVSHKLAALGAEMLGVTTPEEGRALRAGGVKIPILVFGAFLPAEASIFAEDDLTATIVSREVVTWLGQAAEEYRTRIKVHLKVETGMGRFGLWPEEVVAVAREVAAIPGLSLEGVYSHLATAMQRDKRYCRRQLGIFQKTCVALEEAGFSELTKHLANSAAVLELPETYFDMVRVGTLLYGQVPAPHLENLLQLKGFWCLKATVIYLKNLPVGHSAGYGRVFRAKRSTLLALLPVGFVDGIRVEPVLQPTGLVDLLKGTVKLLLRYVGYNGFEAPVQFFGEEGTFYGNGRIVGKVGMQVTMVDVTNLPGMTVGTVARIPARRTAVPAGIPKVYLENGQVVKKRGEKERGV